MLSYLHVRGLALLEDLGLELAPGMNVLTGETGAGKSIIIDALALLRGARARPELIRAGSEQCLVDGQFELGEGVARRIGALLEEHGLPSHDPGSLVVQRTLSRAGRGRSFVQATLTTQAVLGQMGELLIDICSQHEHHSLTRVSRHLELLDAYSKNDALLAEYGSKYGDHRRAQLELEALRARASEGVARADYLRFQIEEFERVSPEPGELDQLRQRVTLLRHAQSWVDFAGHAHEVLNESDQSVAMRLGQLLDRAQRGAEYSPRLAAIAEHLREAQAACEEADYETTRLGSELDFEPGELEQAEQRLHELTALQRKYGTLDDASGTLAAMRAELDTLEHAEDRLRELADKAEATRQDCLRLGRQLSDARRQGARRLGAALAQELAALHLPTARLEARIDASTDELSPKGLDRVELLFSANPGEPPAPLTRVASGGELSRVMLALKSVLSTSDAVATYVFDEVDAGVGGAIAVAIGQRLRRAAEGSQVLCITHLPQIAAFAATHFRVEKHTQAGRTTTRVTALSEEDRIEELARMLGGARITASAREHARELLAEARRGSGTHPPTAPGAATSGASVNASARDASARDASARDASARDASATNERARTSASSTEGKAPRQRRAERRGHG